jgi:hypothetical protein
LFFAQEREETRHKKSNSPSFWLERKQKRKTTEQKLFLFSPSFSRPGKKKNRKKTQKKENSFPSLSAPTP